MSQPEANSAAGPAASLPDSPRAELARRDSPDERIAVIEESLRCFTYGWLACIPFVGVAYLFPAARGFVHARQRKVGWNPARGYLAAGILLTSAGWLVGVLSWLLGLIALMELGDPSEPEVPVVRLMFGALLLSVPIVLVGSVAAASTVWRR